MADNLQLMLLMGPMVPVPVPAALMDALQTAQVTVPTTGASGFQLTFAVSARSLITRVLLPAGRLRPTHPGGPRGCRRRSTHSPGRRRDHPAGADAVRRPRRLDA